MPPAFFCRTFFLFVHRLKKEWRVTLMIQQHVQASGRSFSPAEIDLICGTVKTHSNLSLTELSKTLCALLEWKRPNGKRSTKNAGHFSNNFKAPERFLCPCFDLQPLLVRESLSLPLKAIRNRPLSAAPVNSSPCPCISFRLRPRAQSYFQTAH
jgi:hypothetical protein